MQDLLIRDLILLEQTLPNIPQQELYHAFFQEINLPVILIGEKSSDEDVAAGLETGADDYIVLPCSSSLIVARIRAILRLIDRYRRQKRRQNIHRERLHHGRFRISHNFEEW